MLKRNRAYILILFSLFVITLLSGCNRNKKVEDNTKNKASNIEVTVSPKPTMMEEYNQLLKETTDIESIYQFIEDHIDEATPKETDQLINGLYGYINDAMEVDYARLEEFYYSLPEDVQEFVMLMKTETKIPAIKEGVIKISLNDLLIRCQQLEDHMNKYEDGLTFTFAKNLYTKELVAAITGGYDTVNNKQNVYVKEDSKHIANYAYKDYESFIKNHDNTKTKDIIEQYVLVLDENNKVMNENVIAFYNNIYHTIDEEFGW